MKKNSLTLFIGSFLAGAAILLSAYALTGIFPFGGKALLTIDLSHQYIDFYSFLRQSFFGDVGNLFYSFSTALGGDTFGLTAYYLLSPLNILILLFPESLLLEAVLVITVIKAGLCCAFFALFIDRELSIENFFLKLCFSLLYGLCAYSVVYAMCPMWIDGLILLPLVAIGAGNVEKGKSPLLFCISLIITILSNYYIGFMVCIFIALYYLVLVISNSETLRELLQKVIRFSLFSFVSGLSCSILLLPVFFSLRDGRMGFYDTSFAMYFNFSPLDFLGKLFVGYLDTVKTSDGQFGLPNVYAGVLSVVGLPFYFLNNTIKRKERLSFGGLLLLLWICMLLNPLNLIWHGLQEPYWYPYRFSFLFSFTMLLISLKGFIRLKDLSKPKLFAASAIGIVPFLVGAFFAPYLFVFVTAGFITAYLIIFYKKARPFCLCIAIVSEMVLSTIFYTTTIDHAYQYESRESYTDYIQKLRSLYSKNKEDGLYRTEKTIVRSRNDNMSLMINGLSHYSSSFDANVNRFIKGMGLLQGRFWTKYKGSTPLTDSILGIKYLISDTENPFYEKIAEENGLSLYKNPYALPLAFISNGDFSKYDLTANPFENQLNFINEIIGRKTNVLIKENFEQTALSYSVVTSDSGPLYFYFYTPKAYQCDLYVNGARIGNYFRDYIYKDNNYNIVYAGNYKKGERVDVTLYPPASFDMEVSEAYFYRLDQNRLAAVLQEIEKAEVTQVSATHYKIRVNSDKDTFLLSTIPYHDGFTVTINGEKTDCIKAADTFFAFPVKAGETVIELNYRPQGLMTGAVVSSFFLPILIFILICDKCKRNRLRKAGIVGKNSPPQDSYQ